MALEGSLQDMSLPDLIQIFRMGPKSGVLLLAESTQRGVIYVSEGRLIDAVIVRGPERHLLASGEEAVLQLLAWEQASFTFRHDLAVAQRPLRIAHDSEWLVLEGMRRREHPLRSAHAEQLGAQTRLALSPLPSGAESGVNLDLDQWRLLSQVSICDTLGEICENTGMSIEKAVRVANELIAVGLIEVVVPSLPPPRAPARQAATQPNSAAAPLLATAAGADPTPFARPAGRGLLGAVMRRINGL
jgi:hypothetical protein